MLDREKGGDLMIIKQKIRAGGMESLVRYNDKELTFLEELLEYVVRTDLAITAVLLILLFPAFTKPGNEDAMVATMIAGGLFVTWLYTSILQILRKRDKTKAITIVKPQEDNLYFIRHLHNTWADELARVIRCSSGYTARIVRGAIRRYINCLDDRFKTARYFVVLPLNILDMLFGIAALIAMIKTEYGKHSFMLALVLFIVHSIIEWHLIWMTPSKVDIDVQIVDDAGNVVAQYAKNANMIILGGDKNGHQTAHAPR